MSFKRKFLSLNRKVHRYMAMGLGIQILFWFFSGLVMSTLPIDKVRGKHLYNKVSKDIRYNQYKVSVDDVILKHQLNAKSIKFLNVNNKPAYYIETEDHHESTRFYSGITGQFLSPLEKEEIKNIVKVLKKDDMSEVNIEKILNEVPFEARGVKLPFWRVDFDDFFNTTFYLHEYSGNLLVVRSDLWRLFDFVWMLHIMDYEEREDFNSPLLIFFSLCSFIFTLTGLILVYQFVRNRLYKLKLS